MRKKIFVSSIISIIVILLLYFFPVNVGLGTWGVRKTIGWAWDITNILFPIMIVMVLMHLIGYLILYISKAKYSYAVFYLNMGLLLLSIALLFEHSLYSLVFAGIAIVSALLMLYTNVVIAIIRMMDSKKNRQVAC